MSHSHIRKDKTCLNCGAQVEDRFCSHCGQENTDPRESLGHLIGHFLSDITHYDSKFFTSLRDLLFKPGFLTLEYNAGRRNSYLNPIRMYIFVSAIFFIVLFGGSESAPPLPEEAHPEGTFHFSQHVADSLREVSRDLDSARRTVYLDLAARLDTPVAASTDEESLGLHLVDLVSELSIVENKYHSIGEYDSLEARLPEGKRDDRLGRLYRHRMIRLRLEHPGKGPIVIRQNVGEDIPKIMFVLLPLFALFVRPFYSGKKYLYTQHLIFSLHFHCFVFILLAIEVLLSRLFDGFWGITSLAGVVMLCMYVYLALALARTYRQTLWLSFIKAFAISILYILTLIMVNIGIGVLGFLTA